MSAEMHIRPTDIELDVEKRLSSWTIEETGAIPAAVLRQGERVEVLNEIIDRIEERQPGPRRRSGRLSLTELDSFIELVNRFKESSSTLWAGTNVLTCVFNDHSSGADPALAGWRDHVAVYSCPFSDEWKAWTNRADSAMSQDEFASWLDEHLEDITGGEGYPKSAELMEMTRGLQVHTKGTFQRVVDPTTGQYSLVAKEEHTSNSTKIPRAFQLGLRVFEGGARYAVEARIQFRMGQGRPVFSFSLHRAAEIVKVAFAEVRERVSAETELPLFAGSPNLP